MENFEEKTEIVAENVQGEVTESSEQNEQEVSEQKQENEVADIPAEVVDEQQVEEKQEEQTSRDFFSKTSNWSSASWIDSYNNIEISIHST